MKVFMFILAVAALLMLGALLYAALITGLRRLISFLNRHYVDWLSQFLTNMVNSKRTCKKILIVIETVSMMSIAIPNAYGLFIPRGPEYIYLETGLGTQQETDVLFDRETDDNGWVVSEVHERLHIREGFIGADSFQGMFNYYEEWFPQIYKNGIETDRPDWNRIEPSKYTLINNAYINEADEWKSKFANAHEPACLYQWGRALNDAAMTIDTVSFQVLLEIAADAVSSEEKFLTCNIRNINGEDPIIVNADGIGLLNGKLYLHLAKCAEPDVEGQGYINCLLVMAYQCIKHGISQIDVESPNYALCQYYLGNIGENILARISTDEDSDLYTSIWKEAMNGYKTSITLVERNPKKYVTETNMLKNAEDGIATLNGWGAHFK